MLALKLARVGKNKQPSFRLIVTEKGRDPWGRAVEILGHYDPRSKAKTCVLNKDRVSYWLSVGAQPTATVHNLLVNQGVLQAEKVKVRKNPKHKTLNPKPETPIKPETPNSNPV